MKLRRQNTEPGTPKPVIAASMEPMAEGIRPEKRSYGLLAGMSNEELTGYAEWLVASLDIGGRSELAKADLGLYQTLRSRKLLDAVCLGDLRGNVRNWAAIGEDELVAHAKGFIAGRGIRGKWELQRADKAMYEALRKKNLLERLGLARTYRQWTGRGKEELVALANGLIAERGVGNREELKTADYGLYQALRSRKLLDEVFSNIESTKQAEAVNGVIGALESFGDGT